MWVGAGPPSLTVWWNRRFALSYLLCEVFDGTLRLRPWTSLEPGWIVQELAAADPSVGWGWLRASFDATYDRA
ncbi:hypothetical protein [Streptomyces sp. NPDC048425]|uniref:hypothetical protein n=1 Tax=Streptomyces sp. NPDC048425 TaxID=3365548 RepID=UPI003716D847